MRKRSRASVSRHEASPEPSQLRGRKTLRPHEKRSREWVQPAVLSVLLAGLVIAAFGSALGNAFISLDDPDYVTSNPHVQSGLTWETLQWAFKPYELAANWHPLTWLSHILDYELFGLRPWGHHLTSVFLHALNTVLVFLVLLVLTGARWRSFVVAALFAVHPLRVESVVWISERKDVLSLFFGLLALLAYAIWKKGLPKPGQSTEPAVCSKRTGWYVLSLLCFGAGLLAKPMLVTLPFLLLLLDYWPLGLAGNSTEVTPAAPRSRWANWPGLLLEKVPFIVLSAGVSVVTFVVQRNGGVMHTLGSVPFQDRVSNALVSYARYIGKLIWPEPLSVLYPYQYHWPAAILALSILLVLTVTAGAIIWRRRYPYLFVGWCWFVGTLVPVIGLVPIGAQAMSERYTYLPHLGLLVALVWGIDTWIQHRNLPRKLAAGAVALAFGLCLVQTHRQIAFWKDGETLFRHALQVDPQSAEACYCLGNALREKGEGEAAIAYYHQALELRKRYPEVWHDLGVTLMGLGRVDEALHALEEALNCDPDGAASAEAALCTALGMAGRLEEAIQHGERAVALRPGYSEARQNLAVVLARNKQYDRANENFQEAIRLNPRYAVAHQNWGLALEEAGRKEDAIAEYRRAIALKPRSLQAREYLAASLFGENRFEEAAAEFESLLRLAPNHAPTHNNLGIVLLRLGRRELAAAQFREALRLRPDFADARENLKRCGTG